MTYLTGDEEKEAIQWMKEASLIATQALCKRAKCGTVIVAQDEVIGTGYNAPPLDSSVNQYCLKPYDFSGKPKYDHTCCMHAEWRAIIDALQKNPHKIQGSTIYFTRVDDAGSIVKSGEPFCTVCSRCALDVGIAQFVLWNDTGICVYETEEYNTLSYAYREPIS
jgi:deoxycytidylate deaminase